MNITDDKRPHYGKLPGVHPRANKKIYIADRSYLDGEDATMNITLGSMELREQFIDQLPDVVCYDGHEGLEEAFSEWLTAQRNKGFKK